LILAAAATLVGAAAQSATGFGFALVASPALLAVLEPYEAVTVLCLLGIVLSLLVIADGGPRTVRWRLLIPMLLAALPGLALGVLALDALPKAALQLGVGVAVVAAALVQLRRRRPPAPAASGRPPLGPAVATGITSGVLTTSISVSGPPIVLWLESRGLRPGELRTSLSAAFLVLNVAGGAALVAAGGARATPGLGLLLPLVALVATGHLAGAAVFRRLDAETFRMVVLALVVAAGVASAAAGVVGLAG
jgi:uncharacterized membrane protein YfcA